MDIVASLGKVQQNVKFNSKKQTFNDNLIKKSDSFENALSNSKDEISGRSNKSYSEKFVKNKSVKVKRKISNKGTELEEKQSADKEECKAELSYTQKRVEDDVKELTDAEAMKLMEVLVNFSENLNVKLESDDSDIKAKINDLVNEISGNITDGSKSIKQIVLQAVMGEENPLFADEKQIKQIKELMENVELALNGELEQPKDSSDDIVKNLEFSDNNERTEDDFLTEDENAFVSTAVDLDDKSKEQVENKVSEQKEETLSEPKTEVKEDLQSKIELVDIRKNKLFYKPINEKSEKVFNDLGGKSELETDFAQMFSNKTVEQLEQVESIKVESKVETVKVIEQIVTKAKVILTDEKSTMIMKLNPENLGKVAIKLVSQNGIVKGLFAVENSTVKEMLESNMINLKQQLEDSGIKVDKIEVALNSDNNSEFDEKQNGNKQFDKRNKNKNRYRFIEDESNVNLISKEDLLDDFVVSYSA